MLLGQSFAGLHPLLENGLNYPAAYLGLRFPMQLLKTWKYVTHDISPDYRSLQTNLVFWGTLQMPVP